MAQGYRGEIRGAGRGLVAEEMARPVPPPRWAAAAVTGKATSSTCRETIAWSTPPSADQQTAHAAQSASASPFHPWPLFH